MRVSEGRRRVSVYNKGVFHGPVQVSIESSKRA